MVYENIICVCLHQPPNIADLFPDLPLMLLREAIYCIENDEPTYSGGSALGLYLQLLATSLHLHPPWLTEFWPDASDVMTKALEVENPPRQMITMALAIVLRQEACSTQVQQLLIPLICQVMEQSQEDDEVTVSGLGILSNKKLRPSMRQMLGVWSPVVLAVLGNGENEDVLLQGVRLLACLADAIDLGENEWYFARPLIKLNQGADSSDNIKLLAAATLRKLRKVQIPESMAIKLVSEQHTLRGIALISIAIQRCRVSQLGSPGARHRPTFRGDVAKKSNPYKTSSSDMGSRAACSSRYSITLCMAPKPLSVDDGRFKRTCLRYGC